MHPFPGTFYDEKWWRRDMLACKGHGKRNKDYRFREESHMEHVETCKLGRRCPHDCDKCRELRGKGLGKQPVIVPGRGGH
jgi:hypothetical protein